MRKLVLTNGDMIQAMPGRYGKHTGLPLGGYSRGKLRRRRSYDKEGPMELTGLASDIKLVVEK